MSAAIVPLLAAFVLIYALCRKTDVYDAFVHGAAEGLPTLYRVLPYLAAMLIAIALLRASGILETMTTFLSPALNAIGLPPELFTLTALRPFSGGASMALVADIFQNYGTDSFIGLCASVMMGSSETIFYTLALYFGAINVKKTRYALPVALISGAVGVIASVIICRVLFA